MVSVALFVPKPLGDRVPGDTAVQQDAEIYLCSTFKIVGSRFVENHLEFEQNTQNNSL